MDSYKLWDSTPLMLEGVEEPTIDHYKAENKKTEATVVIFAGGGYNHRARHEGHDYAVFLNSVGMDAFVVNYRLSPHRFPCQLLDARRAVRFVRYNSEKFGIDPTRVAVMGSSAGGHLSALVSTYTDRIDGEGIDEIDEIGPIPNAQILCYPVLDIEGHIGSFRALLGDALISWRKICPIKLATKDTPPAFMWHCEGDRVVEPANTLRYSMKLLELGVSQECHIFPRGSHGIGILTDPRFTDHTYMKIWTDMLVHWFGLIGFLG